MFAKVLRKPICGIYGFVRFADEIVDTFHDFDKKELLDRFKSDTYKALDEGISLNPVLHSFQQVVHEYHIERELIDAFLDSMYLDLDFTSYTPERLDEYIYGSAEVIGLMCLRVFVENDEELYHDLKDPAKRLGAAFQKVNFLRDMKSDYLERGRVYFPDIEFEHFTEEQKRLIEQDIEEDFDAAYAGIVRLPESARLGVYLAYRYYHKLFSKISYSPVALVKEERIRVPNRLKVILLAKSTLRHRMNMLSR